MKRYITTFILRIAFIFFSFALDRLAIVNFGVESASAYFLILSAFLLVSMISRLGLDHYIVVNNMTKSPFFAIFNWTSVFAAAVLMSAFLFLNIYKLDLNFLSNLLLVGTVSLLVLCSNFGLNSHSSKRFAWFFLSQYNLFYILSVLFMAFFIFIIEVKVSINQLILIFFVTSLLSFAIVYKSSKKMPIVSFNRESLKVLKEMPNNLYLFILVAILSALQLRAFLPLASYSYSGIELTALGLAIKIGLAFSLFSSVVSVVLTPSVQGIVSSGRMRELVLPFLLLLVYIVLGLLFSRFFIPEFLSFFSPELKQYSMIVFFMLLSQSVGIIWSFVSLILVGLNYITSLFLGTFFGFLSFILLFMFFGRWSLEFSIYALMAGYTTSTILGIIFLFKKGFFKKKVSLL